MNITYNNLNVSNASNLITFTDIPNILKVTDSAGGTNAVISLVFTGNLAAVTATEPWYITILNETITSVDDYNNAVNKNFYVSTSNISTAASVARALRNCPAISAVFTIEHSGSEVELVARSVGTMSPSVLTNISTSYLTKSITNGTSSSQLYGSMVGVDVYSGSKYITTLEKNWYDGEAAFNMSPVLTTLARIGVTTPYRFKVSAITNGNYQMLGDVPQNHITEGYMVNQGNKFLVLGNNVIFAQNVSRGAEKDTSNNTILYVYGDTIPVSFYINDTGYVDIDVEYLNSAFEVIGGNDAPYTNTDASNKLKDLYIGLNGTYMREAFYVDVIFRDTGQVIRYSVIKPLKATEYHQRILWRNSYGGISFFDFTGQRSETRDLEVETYNKNIFGYYSDQKNQLEMVYDNDVKYTVTLKSHLIENDGKYVFNDLIQSPEVWTEVNGQQYGIILDSVSVEETDRNNIYEAIVKYHYSQKPSLL